MHAHIPPYVSFTISLTRLEVEDYLSSSYLIFERIYTLVGAASRESVRRAERSDGSFWFLYFPFGSIASSFSFSYAGLYKSFI